MVAKKDNFIRFRHKKGRIGTRNYIEIGTSVKLLNYGGADDCRSVHAGGSGEDLQ